MGDDFNSLFTTFEHTAFRLEVRDAYNSPDEQQPLRAYLSGGEVDIGWMDPWLANVAKATEAGRTFRRVRVVSVPLTDYARFGIWLAQHTVAAGEDIRYLVREDAAELPEFDYWLFDSRTVAKLRFDDADTLLGFELIDDPAMVVEMNHVRDVAWHHALKRDDFAAQYLDQR